MTGRTVAPHRRAAGGADGAYRLSVAAGPVRGRGPPDHRLLRGNFDDASTAILSALGSISVMFFFSLQLSPIGKKLKKIPWSEAMPDMLQALGASRVSGYFTINDTCGEGSQWLLHVMVLILNSMVCSCFTSGGFGLYAKYIASTANRVQESSKAEGYEAAEFDVALAGWTKANKYRREAEHALRFARDEARRAAILNGNTVNTDAAVVEAEKKATRAQGVERSLEKNCQDTRPKVGLDCLPRRKAQHARISLFCSGILCCLLCVQGFVVIVISQFYRFGCEFPIGILSYVVGAALVLVGMVVIHFRIVFPAAIYAR